MDFNNIPIDKIFAVLKTTYEQMLKLLEIGDVKTVKNILRLMIFTIDLGERTKKIMETINGS